MSFVCIPWKLDEELSAHLRPNTPINASLVSKELPEAFLDSTRPCTCYCETVFVLNEDLLLPIQTQLVYYEYL